MIQPRILRLAPLLLSSCAVHDSHIAHDAETRLLGMAEVDLESCLGVPDQHSTFGNTDILTYYATSTSSDSWSIPVIGGFSFSNGAYCHATFQVRDGRVTQILYSGEKNATMAPDAYCAPIVRTCVAHLQSAAAAATPSAAQQPAQSVPAAPVGAQAPAATAGTAATQAPGATQGPVGQAPAASVAPGRDAGDHVP